MKNFFPFLEKKVDFALISGDTFEREDINLYTENKILDIFDKYDDIKIFMIFGNHDYYDETISRFVNSFPKNVYVFKNNNLNFYELKNINTRIYGMSWTEKFNSNKKFKVELDPNFYNVFLIHEDLDNNENFYLKNNLSKLQFDYIALGHIHKKFQFKNIFNPGSLSPSSFKDTGEYGFNYVNLDNALKCEFIRSNNPSFIQINYDISNISKDDFIMYFNKLDKNNFYRIIISGYSKIKKIELESIFLHLQEKFLYIEFIDNSYFWDIEKINSIKNNLLFREILKNIELSDNKDKLIELFLEKIGESFEDN